MIDNKRLLLRPSEVAEILGVGRSTAYDLIATGSLPSIRVGKSLRVPQAAVDRWVQDKAKASGETSPPISSAPRK